MGIAERANRNGTDFLRQAHASVSASVWRYAQLSIGEDGAMPSVCPCSAHQSRNQTQEPTVLRVQKLLHLMSPGSRLTCSSTAEMLAARRLRASVTCHDATSVPGSISIGVPSRCSRSVPDMV
eukprot:337415-Rhodomonas_salina.1